MSADLLRQLPGIDAWLATEPGSSLSSEFSREEVIAALRTRLAALRAEIRGGREALPDFAGDRFVATIRSGILSRRLGSLQRVVNATGIVVHTNLGRAPLAEEALAAMDDTARGYSNLEFDLGAGRRGSRGNHVEALICELTGAEAALVVNNCAAAVLLALQGLAANGDVVVSRGELIEIGGSFRMPDVIEASGARMVEVGTTNRTSIDDYARAIGETTRVLLTSHPSNYRIVGFTMKPAALELAALADRNGIEFVHDLGSGTLVDPALAGLDPEPTVRDCVASGAGVVTFSGDKMLGGPQAGVLVGKASVIGRLRKHPLARALRIDKLSLAALAATLRLYLPPNDPWQCIPVLRMLSAGADEIGRRAERVAEEIDAQSGLATNIVDDVSFAGGGALPMSELATRVIECSSRSVSGAELARRLRAVRMPVVARVARDTLLIDLRTVPAHEEPALIEAMRQIVR